MIPPLKPGTATARSLYELLSGSAHLARVSKAQFAAEPDFIFDVCAHAYVRFRIGINIWPFPLREMRRLGPGLGMWTSNAIEFPANAPVVARYRNRPSHPVDEAVLNIVIADDLMLLDEGRRKASCAAVPLVPTIYVADVPVDSRLSLTIEELQDSDTAVPLIDEIPLDLVLAGAPVVPGEGTGK